MFSDQAPIIIPNKPNQSEEVDSNNKVKNKKTIIFVIVFSLLILSLVLFFLIKYLSSKNSAGKSLNNGSPSSLEGNNASSSDQSATSSLPINKGLVGENSSDLSFSDVPVEYMSFHDFYTAPDYKIETKFNDYALPLNVKIDVLNYYALSRKLNLDPGLDGLSQEGFAIIDNPWQKESPDFYSIYGNLEGKQIPSLVTSDFIIYYYQTILKQIFKDIEENIFYNNLWAINKDLYNSAKNRYEARLASIGDINDSILEGERLETAFFAVSLELLKPTVDQVSKKDAAASPDKFSFTDGSKYSFTTPPYLKDDVARELKLIRDAREKTKSPVMLYSRDYKDFVVPEDYKNNAKLNNFYLAKKWLNSVFSLNYKDKNCPNCLVDEADWRLGMIASGFIATDFSDSADLKNKWARIYKVMSFFDPLREDLSYLFYRDSLKSLFGDKYDVSLLFDDKNPEAKNNLLKFRNKLNGIELPQFLGAIDKSDSNINYRRGFKVLSENYSLNDYIFNYLSYPKVDTYLSTSTKPDNITACAYKSQTRRCNGVALDIINLIKPISESSFFAENANYSGYEKAADYLSSKLKKDLVWQNVNYWSNLYILSTYLNAPKSNLPLFSRSTAWSSQNLDTAVGAWVNMQIPVDKFKVNDFSKSQGLDNFSKYIDNSYVEPNLDLINELIAHGEMIKKMLNALQIDKEVPSVKNSLESLNANLLGLRDLVSKELKGQKFDDTDREMISNFTKQLVIDNKVPVQKQLIINFPNTKKSLKEDLSRLKLMVLIHQDGDDRVISVGPVWNYKESR